MSELKPTQPKFHIFVDMDGVLVDFDGYMVQHGIDGLTAKTRKGAYLEMSPMPGALDGIRRLMSIAGQFGGEVWLATKPPTGVAWAYSDKVSWVLQHLPELRRRIILTHDKGLLGGPADYLIDDRPHRANCFHFKGTLICFGTHNDGVIDWANLVEYMHSSMKMRTECARTCSYCLPGTDGGMVCSGQCVSQEDIDEARGLMRLGPVRG